MLTTCGPIMATADVNNDGRTDAFVGGAQGNPAKIFLQNASGGFTESVTDFSKKFTDADALFADFDGDGKTDFAVYRASTGVWYILNSGNGSTTIQNFGLSEDKPVAADYDGDGRADIAVFRPSNGVWYLLRSTSGFTAMQFGISTDTPTPNAYVP